MKQQILSACLAALCFGAACEATKNPRPVEIKPAPPPVTSQPVAMDFIRDAGEMTKKDDAKEIDPIAVETNDRVKVDHLARSAELKAQGDLDAALIEARRQIAITPTDEDALETVAKLARQTGQRELAVKAYERLGSIRSDDAIPLIQQSRLLISMNEFEDAVKVGIEAQNRDPKNPEGYQTVGRAFLGAGNLEKAIPQFQKALELKPDHGFAMNNLGFCYLRANDNEEALQVLTQAAELLPNVAYVHNNLGVALERMGKVDEAKLEYAKSTSLSPKYVKAKVNTARMAKADKGTPTTDSGVHIQTTGGDEKPVPELDTPQE